MNVEKAMISLSSEFVPRSSRATEPCPRMMFPFPKEPIQGFVSLANNFLHIMPEGYFI